jgi:hypothetical protein
MQIDYLGGCHRNGGIPIIVLILILLEKEFLIGINSEKLLVLVKWSSSQLSPK